MAKTAKTPLRRETLRRLLTYLRRSLPILCLTALHLSGCVGDLHNIGLFLTRFRDPSVLRQDTGPAMIYYSRD